MSAILNFLPVNAWLNLDPATKILFKTNLPNFGSLIKLETEIFFDSSPFAVGIAFG
jgi:hypothetical protein